MFVFMSSSGVFAKYPIALLRCMTDILNFSQKPVLLRKKIGTSFGQLWLTFPCGNTFKSSNSAKIDGCIGKISHLLLLSLYAFISSSARL